MYSNAQTTHLKKLRNEQEFTLFYQSIRDRLLDSEMLRDHKLLLGVNVKVCGCPSVFLFCDVLVTCPGCILPSAIISWDWLPV